MNLRRAFLEYDKDLYAHNLINACIVHFNTFHCRSGSISKNELLSVCCAMNVDVDDKEIQDLIVRY